MFQFRTFALSVILGFSLSAQLLSAQETKSIPLNNDSRSFNITTGSSFSAIGRPNSPTSKKESYAKAINSDFREALAVIQQNHASASSSNSEAVFSTAINSMLKQLDPHSTYYTPREFRELTDDNLGRYFGTGMTITDFKQNGESGTYVISLIKDGPAERVGMHFGDRIIAIGAHDVRGMNSAEVRDLIRGPEGSSAEVTVERADKSKLTIRVRRSRLPQPSVTSALVLENSVGYIALSEGFSYTTAGEFKTAFDDLKKRDIKSLVVDLRGNGGGLMEQAIKIAETFLPAGSKIVTQRGRNRGEDREWRSQNPRPETLPLTVLVDENTASASEIFTAAMQDNDRATIVGARTFGKGLVQDIIPLANGSGLTLTSERYYAPSGRSIQREYSDGHLYDYFRHVNTGALIDQPSFAARTKNGRVVYGGDGIQPDFEVPSKTWTNETTAKYESAFFVVRERSGSRAISDHSTDDANIRWFLALANGNKVSATRVLLESDEQMKAALNSLKTPPVAENKKAPQR